MGFLNTHRDVKEEMKRRKSRRQSMLAAFKKEGELTTKDLLKFGSGLSGRLSELRKDGHRIVTVYDSPGRYRYIYLGDSNDDDQSNVSVID